MNQHWHWQTRQDCAYLTCNLLADWQHGFFTQNFYPQTPEALTSILQPNSTAYRVKQVHGNTVLAPQEITESIAIMSDRNDSTPRLVEADAVISDRSQQSAWAASADCTPILIGDLKTGQVCAIHAGWRGTAAKIIGRAVTRFVEFGSKIEDLRVGIGPAISGAMYQVDESVAIKVGRSIISEKDLAAETILSKLNYLANSPISKDDLPGKVRLDVPKVNQIQLEQLGLNSTQIAIAPYCTFTEDKRFFSYRRTGEKKVQWSGIVAR